MCGLIGHCLAHNVVWPNDPGVRRVILHRISTARPKPGAEILGIFKDLIFVADGRSAQRLFRGAVTQLSALLSAVSAEFDLIYQAASSCSPAATRANQANRDFIRVIGSTDVTTTPSNASFGHDVLASLGHRVRKVCQLIGHDETGNSDSHNGPIDADFFPLHRIAPAQGKRPNAWEQSLVSGPAAPPTVARARSDLKGKRTGHNAQRISRRAGGTSPPDFSEPTEVRQP